MSIEKIGLGGGCHWCTEAVYQSLLGVVRVEQGFIAPSAIPNSYSEAIIVHYDNRVISLKDLVDIHLHTHASTSNHSFREKYRSAVYVFDQKDFERVNHFLRESQIDFEENLVTKSYHFGAFKPSLDKFVDYFYKNPEKPFCKTHISPKLQVLMEKFSGKLDGSKINTSHKPV
ncbi:MAG: peptide-methionine (S)-S-oxide reductase [Bacteroidota bacterium]